MQLEDDLNKPMDTSPPSDGCLKLLIHAVGNELLSALDWIKLQPAQVLNLNAVDEELSVKLAAKYPNATVCAVNTLHLADLAQLPYADQSMDLIFANLIVPWYGNTLSLLSEWRRLLRPQGVVIFSALGPDTLASVTDPLTLQAQVVDMHYLGDMLQKEFADPVVERDDYTLVYQDAKELLEELDTYQFITKNNQADLTELTGPIEVTIEVNFAHAFGVNASPETLTPPGEVYISVADLREQLRKK